MKKWVNLYCLVFVLGLITLTTSSFKIKFILDASADVLAKKLLDAVRTKNYDAYKRLKINTSEYTDIVMATDQSDDTKIAEIERFEKMQKEDQSGEFYRIIERLKESGIDPTKIVFERAEVATDGYSKKKSFDIYVFFSAGEIVNSQLRLRNCYQISTGYKINRNPTFKMGYIKDATCEVFAKEIFEMLKKENKEEYKKLVITNDEFLALVKASTLDAEMKERVAKDITKKSPEKSYAASFHSVFAELYRKNIDLSKTEKFSAEYKRENEKGIEVAKITIHFYFDNKQYSLESREALKTSKGWRLSRELRLDSFEADKTERDYEEIREIEAPVEEIKDVEAVRANEEELNKARKEMEKEMQRMIDSVIQKQQADSIKVIEAQNEKGKKKKKK